MDTCYTQEHPEGRKITEAKPNMCIPHRHNAGHHLICSSHSTKPDVIKHAQDRGGSRPHCQKGASSALPPSVPLSLITPGSALSSLAFVDEMFNESFNPASFSPFRSPSPWGDCFVLGNNQRRLWNPALHSHHTSCQLPALPQLRPEDRRVLPVPGVTAALGEAWTSRRPPHRERMEPRINRNPLSHTHLTYFYTLAR